MLEALPVEIIEKIFLHALNLNLPRSSRVLAAALSREHIFKLLILLAFWDDPPPRVPPASEPNPATETVNRVFAPMEYVPLTRDQRAALQEQIFRCRWLTLKRLQEQIPTMVILTIYRQWIGAGMTVKPDEQESLDRFMARKDNSVQVIHGTGPPMKPPPPFADHPVMKQLLKLPGPHEYEMHITPNVVVEMRANTAKTIITWPALRLEVFPPHLLRGRSDGFTEEDVLFLETLRLCSYNYRAHDSPVLPATETTVDRTALHQGVTNAIRTQNLPAVTSLLKLDEFVFRFHGDNEGRMPIYTIPSDHFIHITRHGRDNPRLNVAFFEALIRANAESLPAATREVAEWVLHLCTVVADDRSRYEEINGKFVAWLSDFAMRLPGQIAYGLTSAARPLFLCGELDLPSLDGERFVHQVLRPERETLGNYTPESPVNPADFWLKKAGPELPPDHKSN